MTDLYEHQGKALFSAAGIPVPYGEVACSVDEAALVAVQLGFPLVVKAQVQCGGRGKAGGVQTVADAASLPPTAARILGLSIKNRPVVSLLLEQELDIVQEYYLAITLDRHARRPVLLLSTQGGMDVEEIARTTPGALVRLPLDPLLGLRDYQARRLALAVGLGGDLRTSFVEVVRSAWTLYGDSDATLVEINPLVLARGTPAAPDHLRLVAADAKVTLDDNASFRHPELRHLRPALDERERRARDAGLAYVPLDGTIGVLGNGAGLVMALVDLVSAAGGRAADFLDVGGGATQARIEAALDLLLSDESVTALLIVVFGGITRCDEVARGLLAALRAARTSLPVVTLLNGTNAEKGLGLLRAAPDANLVPAASLGQAVRLAVELGGASAS